MSVSGIGSGAAKEYSALYYSNQVAASRHRAGEVKAPAKADSVVKTRQREQDVVPHTPLDRHVERMV